jgi:hypothetical protein
MTKQKPFTASDKRAIFNDVYNGQKNFMSPTILGFYGNRNMIAEVSTGSGFCTSNPIFGVTFLKFEDGKWIKQHELCKCLNDKDRAIQYAKNTCKKGYALFDSEGRPINIYDD